MCPQLVIREMMMKSFFNILLLKKLRAKDLFTLFLWSYIYCHTTNIAAICEKNIYKTAFSCYNKFVSV